MRLALFSKCDKPLQKWFCLVIAPHRRIKLARQAISGDRFCHKPAINIGRANNPIRKHRHPLICPHQHQHHRGQFNLPDQFRLNLGRNQKLAEDIEAGTFNRIGDQRLIGKISSVNIVFFSKPVGLRRKECRRIRE